MRWAAVLCIYLVALFYWVHEIVPLCGFTAAISFGAVRNRFRLSRRQWITLTIFVCYAVVVSLPSVFYDQPQLTARILLTPILAGVALALISPTQKEVSRVLQCLSVSCTFVAALMYVQTGPYELGTLSIDYLLARYRGDGYWLLGTFYEGAPTIGGPAGLAVVSGVAGGVTFFPVAAFAAAIVILSVSRGAMVASAVASVLLLRGWKIIALGAIVVVVVMLFPVAIEYIPSAAGRYETMLALNQDESMGGRFDLWEFYYWEAKRYPFGQGFSYSGGGMTAHNELIGHWVAAGYAGAMAYLVVLVHWGIRGLRDYRALALLAFFFLLGMVENFSVSSGVLMYPLFWLVAATVLMRRV